MEFSIYCEECGEEMKPGELAVGETYGFIEDDGGFYANEFEWLSIRHSPECPEEEK